MALAQWKDDQSCCVTVDQGGGGAHWESDPMGDQRIGTLDANNKELP
jgi:hypothetical protein